MPTLTDGNQTAVDGDRQEQALSVSIVLPALNEEANIERAIAEATAAAERFFAGHEIIVVDDGSTDGTDATVKGVGLATRASG